MSWDILGRFLLYSREGERRRKSSAASFWQSSAACRLFSQFVTRVTETWEKNATRISKMYETRKEDDGEDTE